MPSGVELYGQTAGLDGTTLGRIQTGFNEIRAIEGWEDFRIPSYVWDWVDQTERDMLLAFIQHSLWVHRDGVDLPADVPKTAHFVFLYVLLLWVEWWYDIPNEMRIEIGSQGLLDKLQTDWGFAEWAFYEDDVYSFHYIATVDPDGYEEFDGYIHHPYHAGWETDAYKLSAFKIYMYHDLAGWSYMYANVGYGGDYIQYYADVDGGQWYRYRDRLYASDIRIADYLGAGWDDRGIPAEGWPEWGAIRANGEHEVLSGRASFKSFGLMDGEVSLNVALDVGDSLTVARGDTPLLTGVVTNVRADLVEGTFAHEIADPVTSKSGEVEYTSGNAITAMQDAIEACGGTFETEMETEETVFYPESPVDAWQFFRAVSYAVGGVLQYGRDGVYRLVEGGSGHSVTDSMVIGDDRPTIEERTKDYANRVAASIDQEWRTPAVEPTNDIFSGGGATANITRLGEQITSQSVGYGDSTSIENSYSYDENNYLVYKKIEEDGEDYARLTEVTFSGISEDGNDYTVTEEETFYTKMMVPDGIGGLKSETVPEEKTTKTFVVDLNGVASVEEIYENRWPSWIGAFPFIPDPDNWLDLWQQTKWYGVIVLKPASGPLEGYTSAKQYNYVHNGFKMDGGNIVPTVGWVQAKCASKSWSVPKLEVYAPEDTHEVHILAKAEDPDAIDALGEHEYECQAVSLDTETGMQAFALGVLFEKGRIRHANVSVPNDDYLSGDSVIWRGLEWQIDTVTVDLDRCSDIIEMVTTSTLARLQNSISREPVSWIEDVKNVVTKRTGLYDNVSRGRILSQVGFRRYLVQAEGKASPVEAKSLTDDPHLVGGSVLLVRPSGKGQPWTLLSLSKEQEILMPATGEAKVTPETEPSYGITEFSADITDPMPGETVTLSWDFAMPSQGSFTKVVIHDGQGGSHEITDAETKSKEITFTEAEDPTKEEQIQFTPTITLVINYGEDAVEYEPFELENGPMRVCYLNIQLEAHQTIPYIAVAEITVNPSVTSWDDFEATTCQIRKSEEADYESISLVSQEKHYTYNTEGVYEVKMEVVYQNSRLFPKEVTLTGSVVIEDDIDAPPLSYPVGSGTFYVDFPTINYPVSSGDQKRTHAQVWSTNENECGPIPYLHRYRNASFDLTAQMSFSATYHSDLLITSESWGSELTFNIGSVSIQPMVAVAFNILWPNAYESPHPGKWCLIANTKGTMKIGWQNPGHANGIYQVAHLGSGSWYDYILDVADDWQDLQETVGISGSFLVNVSLDDKTLTWNYSASTFLGDMHTSSTEGTGESPYTNATAYSRIGYDEPDNRYDPDALLLQARYGGVYTPFGFVPINSDRISNGKLRAVVSVKNIRQR